MSSSLPPTDFGVLLNLAFSEFKDKLQEDLVAAGFDDIGPSFGYVFRLLSNEACSLSELAVHLQMTTPGALKVVEDMVGKGYVSRTADATDKRVKRLRLTPRGEAALKRAREFHARCERTLVKKFGERNVAVTRELLETVANLHSGSRRSGPRPV